MWISKCEAHPRIKILKKPLRALLVPVRPVASRELLVVPAKSSIVVATFSRRDPVAMLSYPRMWARFHLSRFGTGRPQAIDGGELADVLPSVYTPHSR